MGDSRQNKAKIAKSDRRHTSHFLSDLGFSYECLHQLFDFNKMTPKCLFSTLKCLHNTFLRFCLNLPTIISEKYLKRKRKHIRFKEQLHHHAFTISNDVCCTYLNC